MPAIKKQLNRDISWLSFNYRVLEEARDKRLPLYERFKFMAIYSSNMDEFYKVRVAAYRSLLGIPDDEKKRLKEKPEEILKKIQAIVNKQQIVFGEIFRDELIPALEKNNIILLQNGELAPENQEYINEYFHEEIIPYLQPVLLVKGQILPFLRDNDIYLAIKLYRKSKKKLDNKRKKARYAIVNIPTETIPRFILLPVIDGKHYIAFLDEIVRNNLNTLFPGYEIDSSFSIKLSRDADLHIEDEFAGDLVEKISKNLRKRKTGVPSRFLYDSAIPVDFLKLLRTALNLSKEDLVAGGKYHNFSDFYEFPNPLAPKLENRPLIPLRIKELDKADSMFTAISEKDWILHFPYQSYDYVIRFLNEAAIDRKVEEIKVTQYRVAAHSVIVSALISAARNGKKVTVFVEVKARFDEFLNLHFAEEMKNAGVKIIYSIPGLKVHAKVALVIRKPSKSKKDTYAFLSTGNFNEKTAKLYADHGLFTSDVNITDELKNIFIYLEDQQMKFDFKHLLVAQFNMKSDLINKIDREIEFATNGKSAWMILKMNGLEEKKMIDKLYEASGKGVKIDLIIRGICCLIPGKKFSENITITRIVDRFLEHARVMVFHNDGNDEVYLASADWMSRNLNRRIEVGFPIYDPMIKKEVMDILNLQLTDNTKARILDSEHNNLVKTSDNKNKKKIRAQVDTFRYLRGVHKHQHSTRQSTSPT